MTRCHPQTPTHPFHQHSLTKKQLIFEFWTTYSCNFVKSPNDGGTTVGIWYLGLNDGDTCYDKDSHYETDDEFIKSARSGVTLSIICGFGAGILIAFEWLCCDLPCFGCFEGLLLSGAWFFGAAAFLMYGSQGCANIQGMIDNESTETIDGKVNCKYGAASTYMVIAILAYTICHTLLCWYVFVVFLCCCCFFAVTVFVVVGPHCCYWP